MILENITSTLITTITTWIRNFAYTLLTPLVNILFSLVPNFNDFIILLSQLFNIASQYCNYVLDSTLLYQGTLTYIVSTIIFGISFKFIIYTGKLIAKWWEALV